MICDNCGHTSFHADRVTRTFHIDGKFVIVENVPAEVCDRCGDAGFDAQVAERLRQLVHRPTPPARVVQADVLRFDAA